MSRSILFIFSICRGAAALLSLTSCSGSCADETAQDRRAELVSITQPPIAERGERVTCPVCGLEFDREEARSKAEHAGQVHFFLLDDHRLAFIREPSRYLPKDSGDGAGR